MASQYELAFKAPQKQAPPPIASVSAVPVVLSVDSYNIPADNRNKYTVELASDTGAGVGALRDVVSIELIQASVPVNGNDLYVILNVNGYSRVKSNNNNAANSFCIIPCQNPGVDVFNSMRRTGSTPDDNYVYYFPEPSRLSKLEIELVSPTGDNIVYNDNHLLTFEIRTLNRAPKTDARFHSNVQGPW
jgi:hypothetical protein